MVSIGENSGTEQEESGSDTDIGSITVETVSVSGEDAPLPDAGADLEPNVVPVAAEVEEEEEEADKDDDPLSGDFMDIFENEDVVEVAAVVPGLATLTMSEVSIQTETTLEDVKSRYPL